MKTVAPAPREPNPLGTVSLVLGTLSSTCVSSVGLCAGVGKQQGWLAAVGTLLFLVGATFAFVGLLAAVLGALGWRAGGGRGPPRARAWFWGW